MELSVNKPVKVQAKTLNIHTKVCDQFTAALLDQDGAILRSYEGYVPGFMPGRHFGDYIILHIDIDTGKITNWEVPKAEDIQAFINREDEE